MDSIKLSPTSLRTFQRIRKNPENANVKSLYAYAETMKLNMEEILKKPLYLFNLKIDGYVNWNGFIYAYTTEMPKRPLKTCIYVYIQEDEKVLLSRKVKEENAVKIGVCVAKIKILQTEYKEENTIIKITGDDE